MKLSSLILVSVAALLAFFWPDREGSTYAPTVLAPSSAPSPMAANPEADARLASVVPGAQRSRIPVATVHDPETSEGQTASPDSREVHWDIERSLARFRSALNSGAPHIAAWRDVNDLAVALSTSRDIEDTSPLEQAALAVLAAPTIESPFVRGAVLMALGLSTPEVPARNLGARWLTNDSDEFARTALILSRVTLDGGISLAEFKAEYTRSGLSTWPVSVSCKDVAASALNAVETRLSVAVAEQADHQAEGLVHPDLWRDSTFTSELTVVAHLGELASHDGPARDRLFQWATQGSEISHASIWVLCRAARSDADLLKRLAGLLTQLDPTSGEFALLSNLIMDMTGRGDLVIGPLGKAMRGTHDQPFADGSNLGVLRCALSLGQLLRSSDEAVAQEASDILMDVALRPGYADDLRLVTLYELASETPEAMVDVLELILVQPDNADVQLTATVLAAALPREHSGAMEIILCGAYQPGRSPELQEAYAHSLMSLGGDGVRATLALIQNENVVGVTTDDAILDFLDS